MGYLGRGGGEVVLEEDLALVEPALPDAALLPGDPELPGHQVHRALPAPHGPGQGGEDRGVAGGGGAPGDEAEGVVLPPGLALLREALLGDTGHPRLAPI